MLSETCIFCGNTFKVPDEFQGKKVKCPRCKELLGISVRKEPSEDEPGEPEAAARPTPLREPLALAMPSPDEAPESAADALRFEGEDLVLETRPSTAALVVRVAAVVVVVLTLGGVVAALPTGLATMHKVAAVLVCVLLGVGIGALIGVEWANTVYLLTSARVLSRRGVIVHRVKSCPLDHVGHVVLKAGPFARLLGIGTLHIGTGSWWGRLSWRGVDDPQAVANLIAQHVDHRYAFLTETEGAFRNRSAQAQ